MGMLKDFLDAFAAARAKSKAQKKLDDLVGNSLSYPIIKDLAQNAVRGVKTRITMKSGEVVEFLPLDPFDREQHRDRKEFF